MNLNMTILFLLCLILESLRVVHLLVSLQIVNRDRIIKTADEFFEGMNYQNVLKLV